MVLVSQRSWNDTSLKQSSVPSQVLSNALASHQRDKIALFATEKNAQLQHLGFKEQSQSLCKRSRSNRELENISIDSADWSFKDSNTIYDHICPLDLIPFSTPFVKICDINVSCSPYPCDVLLCPGLTVHRAGRKSWNWPCILSLLYKRRADQATKSIRADRWNGSMTFTTLAGQ